VDLWTIRLRRTGSLAVENASRFPPRAPLPTSSTDHISFIYIFKPNIQGGWLLEVVDEHGNSVVWDASFSSDREALHEALNTIEREGIGALIGSPSGEQEVMDFHQPLSEAELDELDDFLADESIEDRSMDVSTMEGFLTSIAIGPRAVLPSEWLPWVWDIEEGQAEARFESEEQANRILSLVMRHYNAVVQTFLIDPASFKSIFWRGDQWGAAEWCEGFMVGFQFSKQAWSLLAVGQPTWFAPFLRLGTDEGIHLTKKLGDAEKWMNEIEPSLGRMHTYWKDKRVRQPGGPIQDEFRLGGQKEVGQVVRGGPKVGRNDPCPCGSGRKFKKCCGAIDASAALH
jgi:uncharacterized protein